MDDLYDAQYDAVRAVRALGMEPWALRATVGAGPTRYYVRRGAECAGPYDETRALVVAARRNRWLVSHERKVRRQAS